MIPGPKLTLGETEYTVPPAAMNAPAELAAGKV
jgi:hypothetical protein